MLLLLAFTLTLTLLRKFESRLYHYILKIIFTIIFTRKIALCAFPVSCVGHHIDMTEKKVGNYFVKLFVGYAMKSLSVKNKEVHYHICNEINGAFKVHTIY